MEKALHWVAVGCAVGFAVGFAAVPRRRSTVATDNRTFSISVNGSVVDVREGHRVSKTASESCKKKDRASREAWDRTYWQGLATNPLARQHSAQFRVARGRSGKETTTTGEMP